MQKLQAEIRYLQIRLRACGPESGPFRGFQGSAAPQRHGGRRLGVWLVSCVGVFRPEFSVLLVLGVEN
jgi:hypothetical protein